MANINRVMLAGNLTRDPELRSTPAGVAVASFGMAVNRKYKNAAGELKEETAFLEISTFAQQAETVSKFLTKGSGVFVEGRLKFEQWEDKTTGQKRSKIRVIADRVHFLPSKKSSEGNNGSTAEPVGAVAGSRDIPEEDVPF